MLRRMAALEEIDLKVGEALCYKNVSNEIRQLIISRLNSGGTLKEVTIAFDVDYKYASKLQCKYRKTGQILKKCKGHRVSSNGRNEELFV